MLTYCFEDLIITSVLHGWPWVFFGPPVAIPEKNHTRMLGHRKFMATGMGFSQAPVFPRELQVMGF